MDSAIIAGSDEICYLPIYLSSKKVASPDTLIQLTATIFTDDNAIVGTFKLNNPSPTNGTIVYDTGIQQYYFTLTSAMTTAAAGKKLRLLLEVDTQGPSNSDGVITKPYLQWIGYVEKRPITQ